MPLRMNRRIMVLALLLAFVLSAVLQGFMASHASAGTVAATDIAMSMDAPMDCPGPDGIDRANCKAICAAFTGILFEPMQLPVLGYRAEAFWNVSASSLSDRGVIPEPHPPKPSSLI